MTNCNNYYNNASNNINKRYAGEYNNANSYIYSNTDSIFVNHLDLVDVIQSHSI